MKTRITPINTETRTPISENPCNPCRKLSRRNFVRAGALFLPSVYLRASTTIIPGPLARHSVQAGFSAEPDLSDWVSRVQGQSSDVTGAGVQTAVGNFIVGCKTDGLWTRGYRIGAYAGDGRLALKAPLKNTLGAATDTLTGFVDANYGANGLVGGSGKRIETGFNMALLAGGEENNFSVAVYVRAAAGAAAIMLGCGTSGDATKGLYLYQDTGQSACSMWAAAGQVSASGTQGGGFFLGSRTASNSLKLFKNGSQIGSTSTSPGTNVSLFDIWVHDGNLSNSSWLASSQTFCFYWIGKGLDSTQQGNLYTRVQTLQTAFSRQV